jgi:IS5 family transposase
MMVHFRKRFSEEDLKRIKELLVQRGKAMLIEAVMNAVDGDDSDDQGPNADVQLSLDDLVKPAEWPEGKNLALSASMPPGPLPISPIQQTSNC